MTKLAWAARGISAATGAVLLGSLMVPSAAASGGMDHDPHHKKASSHPAKAPASPDDEHKERCSTSRDISTAGSDFGFLAGTLFRLATDRRGHAFLNDSRNPGVWINLGILANAPKCVTDTAASITEAGTLTVNLLARDGVIHQARCTASATPFTPANLPAACGTGFSPVEDTPV
ncbi:MULTISPECIES: hypothetical protein [Streptomyces]|uniref:hypothetical protein n=1 Tax=Streptomyces TaxID=1883 RepID=UPI000A4C0D13|nr:hypothetical protein [Streptomyces katrae]